MLSAAVTDAVVDLGRLALRFGRVHRITFHEDGRTPESDTDHTVMLGLIACVLAPKIRADLDVGLVAQFCLVHDLAEVYAGDTATLRMPDPAARADKARREDQARRRIAAEFGPTLPDLPRLIVEYESGRTPEARYVRALDKLLPKIAHILNGLATVRREEGVSVDELAARYTAQAGELAGYAGDFPALLELHAELVARLLERYRATDAHAPTEGVPPSEGRGRHG